MRPELVIFDCDGVLVDSEPASLEVVRADLRGRGLDLTWDEADELFTGGTMRGTGEAARALGADIPVGWTEQAYAKVYARLREGVPLIAGVVEVMDRLEAAGVPFCVGSNGAEEKMRITLTPSGLHDRLRGRLYSAHTHGVAKPDPGLFLIAARDFGVAPEKVAVIDDSPSGVKAAVAAGMRCLGYCERTDPARLAPLGAEIVRDMKEVAAALGLQVSDRLRRSGPLGGSAPQTSRDILARKT